MCVVYEYAPHQPYPARASSMVISPGTCQSCGLWHFKAHLRNVPMVYAKNRCDSVHILFHSRTCTNVTRSSGYSITLRKGKLRLEKIFLTVNLVILEKSRCWFAKWYNQVLWYNKLWDCQSLLYGPAPAHRLKGVIITIIIISSQQRVPPTHS